MEVKKSFFGTSGIRGVVNNELTPTLALQLGAALASQICSGEIVVGRDTRISGKMLENALVAGTSSCGSNSRTLGIVPTPVLAYLARELKANAGVAISASHNPPQYNGLKVFDSTTLAYTDVQQKKLEELINQRGFVFSKWNTVGSSEAVEVKSLYISGLTEILELKKSWKIVCDLFNGATCSIASEIFNEFRCNATYLNAQCDGLFPSGSPEPTSNTLKRLGYFVKKTNAEIGFGFDGDGDRMIPIDEKGRWHYPDRVLAAYAGHIVESKGGGVVVTHIGTSMCIEDVVLKAGGSLVRTKVGDVSIADAVMRHEAIFGGEPVGAWIHPDVHLCPDGILSALRLMKALEDERKTLSEFIAEIPEYPLLRAKIDCPNLRKKEAMNKISTLYRDTFDDMLSASVLDGVRIELDEGWTLIRPSGTEPVIRITVEAENMTYAEELMEKSRWFVLKVLEGKV